MRYAIPRLNIMIAYSCNISCLGCLSVSDIKRNGVESIDSLYKCMDEWSMLLAPEVLTIFGGEPLLHPKFCEVIQHARESWPNSIIRVITNGLLLDKIPAEFWFSLGKLELQVSIHREDFEPQINASIKRILSETQGWKVTRYTDKREHRQVEFNVGDVTVFKSKFKDFVVPYRRLPDAIVPHYSDPVKAHAICGEPSTPILYKGKLYKCSPVANLIDITGSWMDYQGLTPDQDISSLINNIGKPESVCGGCPDRSRYKIDHFNIKNVKNKRNS